MWACSLLVRTFSCSTNASKTGYYSYYQSLFPHVHKGISNAFWIMSTLPQMKHIMSFITAQTPFSINNMLSASKSPLAFSVHSSFCQQSDRALHILSGCQHNIISGMITERHNVACGLIMKAIREWLLGRLYSSYGCWQHWPFCPTKPSNSWAR